MDLQGSVQLEEADDGDSDGDGDGDGDAFSNNDASGTLAWQACGKLPPSECFGARLRCGGHLLSLYHARKCLQNMHPTRHV